MWTLQTNLPNAHHIQDMGRAINAKTNQDHAHPHEKHPIRLKRRDIQHRSHNQGCAIRRKCQQRCQNTNGPIKSIWHDQQNAPMDNTIKERNTNRYDQTHKTRPP